MPIVGGFYYSAHIRGHAEIPPVVLIHGAGGNHLYWPAEMRRLPGFTIYAVDLPGHGKSAGPGEQTITAYARELTRWMEALSLDRAVVIGHSMGGAIAMTLALQETERVAALGLVATGARLAVNPQILENASNPVSFRMATEQILARSFPPQTPARLIEIAGRRLNEVRPSVLHGDLQACDRFDIRADIGTITCPTLILCGDQDELTPLRYSQYLASAITNARLVVIPSAGHMVALEQPKAVAITVQSFLASLLAGPAP